MSCGGCPDCQPLNDLLDYFADQLASRLSLRLGGEQEPDPWLDLKSAAAHLGVHPDTLAKAARARRIPVEQERSGCRMYFRRSDLDAWRQAGGGSVHLARVVELGSRRPERSR
jgi:hypothetical protein